MAGFRRPAEAPYDGVARFLHWSIVVLIAIQFVIGWTMPDVHHDTKPVGLIAWHLGVGATSGCCDGGKNRLAAHASASA